ncbi:MAG: trypsin-like serine protease [Desulfobacteraceae bacterium]|nr:trypsin-like serine protease [Desulfobacteraceae bacterium]
MKQKTLFFLLIWGMIIITLYVANNFFRNVFLTEDTARAVAPRGELADFEKSTMAIFDNAAPSVVYLFTERAVRGFFGMRSTQQGAGSGFLWDRAGHVVTNYHVVEGSQRIQVRLDSGRNADATLVGGSPDHDIAVVRLRSIPSEITPIPVGTSNDLRVGQAVFAIGNPFGLSRTLTTGVISALNRRLQTPGTRELLGVIQTDAAINPGNSGGPLLDSAGRLIGVNTAIISESGQSAGIGFAVPVDVVNEVVPQLINHGKVPRPGIGISILSEEMAARIGEVGIVIDKVFGGSEAERAGLIGIDYRKRELGDIIIAVEGVEVKDMSDFLDSIQQKEIGEVVTLTVKRHSNTREVSVRIMDIS